jgi:hypothetical protein
MQAIKGREQKTARKKVSVRLRDFYSELKALVDVDTEDFYRRVMQQAQKGRNDAPTHEII